MTSETEDNGLQLPSVLFCNRGMFSDERVKGI